MKKRNKEKVGSNIKVNIEFKRTNFGFKMQPYGSSRCTHYLPPTQPESLNKPQIDTEMEMKRIQLGMNDEWSQLEFHSDSLIMTCFEIS